MNPGFNGIPNIKMEDGGMGSIGLKVTPFNNNFQDEQDSTDIIGILWHRKYFSTLPSKII